MAALTRTLLLPLHVTVLASLHAVLASTRLLRLIARLAALVPLPRFRQHAEPTPAADLRQKRWQKLPKHLAVALVPGTGSWAGLWALQHKVAQVRRLLGWSRELGIQTLSVYDETGARLLDARDHPLLLTSLRSQAFSLVT